MARPILMPQVGQDLTEGKIVGINVKLGDKVKKGDIVAEVESEKATFEVEAFETGTIIEIRHKVGDIATVLQPLMMVGEPGEVVSGEAAASAPKSKSHKSSQPNEVSGAHAAPTMVSGGSAGSSPLARRLAQEAGVDLRQINGSGPGGAVVKADIEAFKSTSANGSSALADSSAAGSLRSLQTGSGDPVVFIHGFGADLSAWRPFVLHLGISNPVLAVDLPGHGSNADAEVASFRDLVAAVHASLRSAGIRRLHLAGHSLGAAVAASLAVGGDLEVRSLSLLAPAGLGPRVNGDYTQGFLSATSEAALKAWLEVLVHKPASLPGALVRATLAAREGTKLAAMQKKVAAGLFEGNTQLFSIRDALDRYTGPARVVVGTEDRIIPSSYADAVPAHVAVHRLPHVGHLPQLEAASLVARLVAETIRSAG